MKTYRITINVLWIIAVAFLGCSYHMNYNSNQSLFFGAEVVSQYYYHFDDGIVCAEVKGFHGKETKCLCMLTDEDARLNGHKTLLLSEKRFCKK